VTYSIVVPAYNEAQRIGATLEKAISYSAQRRWQLEILVVNDGSTDATAEIVHNLAARNPVLRLLENPGNRGKGYGVRNGMLHARGEVLLFSDADFSSPIEEAEKLFGAIAEGADIAIGSRWLRTELQTRKQPIYRQVYGRLFNLALRLVLGLNFKDTQCGFKAFSRRAANVIFPLQNVERWGFDPELLYLAQKFGLKIVEVPVTWAHREGTRLSPLRDGIHMLGELFRIRWNSWSGKYAVIPQGAPTALK
jgi:glycosyltransferase involved in cell wall biosynthesis